MQSEKTRCPWTRWFALLVLGWIGWAAPAFASNDPPDREPTVSDFDDAYKEINAERVAIWERGVKLLDGGLTNEERNELDDLSDEAAALERRAHLWYLYGMRYPEIYGQSSFSFSWLEGQIASDATALERLAGG